MATQYNWYVFILTLNAVFAGALFFYTLKFKKVPEARYFAWGIIAAIISDFSNVFELIFIDLNTKILFQKISYVGAVSLPVLWIYFALAFSQKCTIKKKHLLLFLMPATVIILTWTNEFHKLVWPDIYLTSSPYGIVAIYKHGIAYFTSVVYSYSLIIIGTVIFLKKAFSLSGAYRTQSFFIIITLSIPWLNDILYVAGILNTRGLYPETFSFTISAALIAFGYFRYGLFSVVPIAHEIIYSSIHEGIIVTDINNCLIEANNHALRLFDDEIKIGESILSTLEKYFNGLNVDSFNTRQEVPFSNNSHELWFEFNISQVKDFKHEPLGKIFMIHEITERKTTEKALEDSRAHLSELNNVKNKFFSILSHDLRSPFSGLIGLVEILKEDYNILNETEKDSLLNEIDITAKNIFGFLEDLLEWSRLNMGSFKVKTEPVNLFSNVQEVFNLLEYNARKKGIMLVNELNPDDKATGDSAMVKLLVRNLVSNAIKFSSENDRVKIYSRINDSFIDVSVSDTGTGIPKEALGKLFRLDIKHTTPGTANERGSGIGLVLCKEILEKLNGKIKVESEPGKGSTFIFSLPLN